MKISLKNDITSISDIKANLNSIVDKAEKNQRPVIFTQNGKSAGVVLDIKSWEYVVKKINLLKLVIEGEQSLEQSKPVDIKTLKKRFKEKYDI